MVFLRRDGDIRHPDNQLPDPRIRNYTLHRARGPDWNPGVGRVSRSPRKGSLTRRIPTSLRWAPRTDPVALLVALPRHRRAYPVTPSKRTRGSSSPCRVRGFLRWSVTERGGPRRADPPSNKLENLGSWARLDDGDASTTITYGSSGPETGDRSHLTRVSAEATRPAP